MGFKESLIQGIREFSASPGTLKCSVGIGFLAIIFNFTGILTDYWLQGGSSDNDHQGLWNYCQDSSGYECCSTLSDHVDNIGISIPSYIVATQVFIILGLILATFAFVTTCIVLFSQKDSCEKCFSVFYIFAVFCLLITVAVYGGQHKLHDLTREYNLHVSFGLTVAAMFLYPLAFGLYASTTS